MHIQTLLAATAVLALPFRLIRAQADDANVTYIAHDQVTAAFAKGMPMLEVGDYNFRVYANGGRVGSVEVATPWAAADIFALDYDQTNDVLDVVHKAYPPQRISRVSNTAWQVAGVATKDGQHRPESLP